MAAEVATPAAATTATDATLSLTLLIAATQEQKKRKETKVGQHIFPHEGKLAGKLSLLLLIIMTKREIHQHWHTSLSLSLSLSLSAHATWPPARHDWNCVSGWAANTECRLKAEIPRIIEPDPHYTHALLQPNSLKLMNTVIKASPTRNKDNYDIKNKLQSCWKDSRFMSF